MSLRLAPRGSKRLRAGVHAISSSVASGAATRSPPGLPLPAAHLTARRGSSRSPGRSGSRPQRQSSVASSRRPERSSPRHRPPLPACARDARPSDKVDAGDVPASLRELDGPDPTAAADVQRPSKGLLSVALLAGEQAGDLLANRSPRMRHPLPGGDAECVHDPVVHGTLTGRLRVTPKRTHDAAILPSLRPPVTPAR